MSLPWSLSLKLVATVTALLAIGAPQALSAERDVIDARSTSDIALGNGGVLLGQVVNAQGSAMGNVVVSVRRQHEELARTTADKNGRFAIRGLGTGTYQLVTRSGQRQIRAWAQSAPPNAELNALVVDGLAVRGQSGTAPPVSGIPSSILLNPPDDLPSPDQSVAVEEIPYGRDQTAYTSSETGDEELPVSEASPATWSEAPYEVSYGNGSPVRQRRILSRPWLWGTGVAAAIALPIALDHDDDGDAS